MESSDPLETKLRIKKGHKLEKICNKLLDIKIPFEKIYREINELIKHVNVETQFGVLKSDAEIIDKKLL